MRPITSVFYCMSLDTGVILVGWLSLLLNMVVATYILPNVLEPSTQLFTNMWFAWLFSTLFVHMVCCILAIVGASKKNSDLMLPWLFGQVHEIIVLAIMAFYILIFEWSNYLPTFIGILAYLPIQAYFWLCIFSLVTKLEGERRKQAYKRLQEIRKIQAIEKTVETSV